MKTKNIKLSELPEATADDGVKEYGVTSYETQIAILSHYLHSLDGKTHVDYQVTVNVHVTSDAPGCLKTRLYSFTPEAVASLNELLIVVVTS